MPVPLTPTGQVSTNAANHTFPHIVPCQPNVHLPAGLVEGPAAFVLTIATQKDNSNYPLIIPTYIIGSEVGNVSCGLYILKCAKKGKERMEGIHAGNRQVPQIPSPCSSSLAKQEGSFYCQKQA